ncbi:MAG TPA: class I fructose-bisphosphate aldolase [Anaerolineae bacterium]|nr:class I fructose-bisphosphate aldolase [Anaerolineae bacterium]
MSEKNEPAQAANTLEETALTLVRDKGILAADESSGTIKKRFDQIGVPSTEENRRSYRDILFTTEGAEEFISGVILFDETIHQRSSDGTPFPELLASKGIIPGIKVDKGLKDLAGSKREKIAEGLDGLRERLIEYRSLGARFAKWRTVYSIDEGLPTDYCIEANAHVQAYYAALCIEQGLVPIVEPEVLMDGDHSIQQCYDATKRTLTAVFSRLSLYGVPFEQMLLKTNMVLSGSEATIQADDTEIAQKTLECFREVLPPELPGVVFLSGGQTEQQATARLNAINAAGRDLPWYLSFSYGRALQASALRAWKGQPENRQAAQQAYLHRARLNGAALHGQYQPDME